MYAKGYTAGAQSIMPIEVQDNTHAASKCSKFRWRPLAKPSEQLASKETAKGHQPERKNWKV
jgi:hypothetical protein